MKSTSQQPSVVVGTNVAKLPFHFLKMGCFSGESTLEEDSHSKRNKAIEKMISKEKKKYKSTYRLLLLGKLFTLYLFVFILLECNNIEHHFKMHCFYQIIGVEI